MQVAAFHFCPALHVSFCIAFRYSKGTTDRNIATKLSTTFYKGTAKEQRRSKEQSRSNVGISQVHAVHLR
jgi:hypothetical protein